jgi:NADPH-dependent ferric siderophore reductase
MVSEAPAKPVRRPIVTRVETVERLTPHMIRIVVGGDDLEGFDAGEFTDHYVKVQFPPPGASYGVPFDMEEIRAGKPREEWPRTRSYTVVDWDADALKLTLDFVVHGDSGVAGPWAAAAAPGDYLQLTGPGGAYTPDPGADWHLMVGDESVIPAIHASLRRIPEGVPVHVVLEVDGPGEEQPLTTPGDLRLIYLHRNGNADALAEAVAALDFPAGEVHAFIHGEATSVREVRKHLLADRGIERGRLSCSGYWKLSRTDEDWRAEKRDWNALVEADVTT